MATATDDNAADEKSDKSIWQLLNFRCTSSSKVYFLLYTMSDKSRSGFFPFNRIFQKIPSSYADTVPDLHRHCTDALLPVQ